MEILKDISIIWSLIHALVMFLLLFEPRYGKKKSLSITLATMVPLIIINFLLFLIVGFEKYGTLMLLTLSLPSCIVFFILSKYRDGRFFFTFCAVDTMVLEILYVTNILNHYLTPDTYIVLFVIRILAYPLIELWLYKKVRQMYLQVQKQVTKGWVSYGIIGISFYLAVTLLMNYPTTVTDRPEDIPALVILFVLMPVIYINIITTLRRLQAMHEMTEQDTILKMQVSNLTTRMNEFTVSDEKFRIERHNFRHKLKTIAGMIKKEQYEDCLRLLEDYEEALDKTKVKRYCQHTILDAMLFSYISKAQNKGIRVEMGFAFPDEIPMEEPELATAIANALENAINACEQLEPEKRFIEIKVISHPRFMLRIVNSYKGDVSFDDDGIPTNPHHDHGFGTRYIAAFCNKNNGFYHFDADGERFTLMLNF